MTFSELKARALALLREVRQDPWFLFRDAGTKELGIVGLMVEPESLRDRLGRTNEAVLEAIVLELIRIAELRQRKTAVAAAAAREAATRLVAAESIIAALELRLRDCPDTVNPETARIKGAI